jgi:hypothetical protein
VAIKTCEVRTDAPVARVVGGGQGGAANTRADKLKKFASHEPSWASLLVLPTVFLLLVLALTVPHLAFPWLALDSILVLICCAGVILGLTRLRTNRIFFRHHREMSKSTKEIWRKRIEQVVLLGIGAFFSAVGTLVVGQFKK